MSLYRKARKHFNLDRAKELYEEKIRQKKIAEVSQKIEEESQKQEQILASLEDLEMEKYRSNWRQELKEGMTSAGMFSVSLPAEGDTDLIDYGFDDTYITSSPDEFGYDDVSTGTGSGSGYQGGFLAADGRDDVIQLSAFGEYDASVVTTEQDLSAVDTLSITAIAGNDTNGGLTPVNGLQVYFLGPTDFAGPFDVISSTQSSYATVQVPIPENMRKERVRVFLYSDTSDYVNGMNFSVRHFGNQTFNVPGLDFTTIRNLFAYDDPGEENGEDFLSFFFRRYSRDNPDNMKSIGFYYWYNVNAQRFGVVDDTREASEGGNFWPQWPSPPINSERTNGDSGGNYAGQPRDEDYIRIGEMIWDQFVGTKLFGISKISLKRRAQMNVFVPLDDPEATSFIRDGSMDKLSPAEKKKKLEEQLAASKEYLDKMFGEGMPGTTTQIADIQPQQSFVDMAQEPSLMQKGLDKKMDDAGPMAPMPTPKQPTGGNMPIVPSDYQPSDTQIALDTIPYEEPSPGPGGYKPPGSYDPNKFYDLKNDPSQLPSPNLPSTGPGRSSVPDGTEVAASYPTTRTPLDKVGGFKGIPKGKGIYPMDKDGNLYNPQTGLPIKQASTSDGTEVAAGGNPRNTGGSSSGDPNNIQWPRNKYPNKKAPPGPGYRPPTAKKKQTTMVAHHEPQGKVLKEKKSFKDLTKKIPGYYDGKPSPLGFPIEEPPKMKNGMHPDLVDGKKVADRFNRLDPESAKAMPPTGNPHIDKKVKAAAKKPK